MSHEAGHEALQRIGDDPHNAYITLFEEPETWTDEGPLHGKSLAVKDNLALEDHPLTCASRTLETYHAPYTATSVQRALDAGASIVGKTNMDEFAAGGRGEHSAFGPTTNPLAEARVTGGSSGGSGATLANRDVDLALGTDTGGSVRSPAAYMNLLALKPTNGRISRWGLVDLAMSLDQPGPMARTVTDLARLYDAIHGPDPRDPTTLDDPPSPTLPHAQNPDIEGTTIGYPDPLPEGASEHTNESFQTALDTLEMHGATLEPLQLPDAQEALAVYYVTNYAEFASAMHKFDGTLYGAPGTESREQLGPEVKRRILLGTFITTKGHKSAWYERALDARAKIKHAWEHRFETVDVVATPTMPTPPPPCDDDPTPLEEYAADILTVQPNLTRHPAGTVPMPPAPEGPLGLQLIAPPRREDAIIETMSAYTEATQ